MINMKKVKNTNSFKKGKEVHRHTTSLSLEGNWKKVTVFGCLRILV